MFRPPLDSRNWQVVHAETSPSKVFNYEVQAEMPFRSDVALITVTSELAKDTWVKAGWVQQIWDRGILADDYYLIDRQLIYLNLSLIFPLEPVENSIIVFNPVGWLFDWNIVIEATPYQEEPSMSD